MVAKRPQCQYSGQSLVVRYEPDASTCVNAIASYTSLHVLSHPSSKVRSSTSKISVAAACLATLGVRGHQIKNNLYMAFCQPKRWAFFHHTKDPRVKMQSPTYHYQPITSICGKYTKKETVSLVNMLVRKHLFR